MSNTTKNYDFVKADKEDSLLKFTINKYREDIAKCFPGIDMNFERANSGYVVCHEGKPTGIMLGELKDGAMEILLDYSIPEYRDFSIGQFLFSKLPEEGIKSVTYKGSDANHKAYLEKTGFVKKGDYYEKTF